MIFEMHFPAPPLSEYIANMVFYEDFIPPTPMEKLLPDGSIFLLIDFEDKPKKCWHSEDFSVYEEFTRSYVSGQHKEFIFIESTQLSSMLVVQFKAGGAAPFFRCPISELNGNVRHSEAYFGDDLNRVRDELRADPDIASRFRRMEAFLLERMQEPEGAAPMKTALEALIRDPFRATTRELAATAGVSQKHLIHLFDRHVGLTPKALARIFRFQQVLQRIEESAGIDWLQIVADCGYYDQSHFVKDFYAFSGINPGAYPDARGEYMNFLPISPE